MKHKQPLFCDSLRSSLTLLYRSSQTSNPRYEEFFTFGLDDPASAQLKVKCFHYDTIVPDYYICMSQLSLHDLQICDASDDFNIVSNCGSLGATEVAMTKVVATDADEEVRTCEQRSDELTATRALGHETYNGDSLR